MGDEPGVELTQLAVAHPGSDATRVDPVVARAEREMQGPEAGARAPGLGKADDREIPGLLDP